MPLNTCKFPFFIFVKVPIKMENPAHKKLQVLIATAKISLKRLDGEFSRGEVYFNDFHVFVLLMCLHCRIFQALLWRRLPPWGLSRNQRTLAHQSRSQYGVEGGLRSNGWLHEGAQTIHCCISDWHCRGLLIAIDKEMQQK